MTEIPREANPYVPPASVSERDQDLVEFGRKHRSLRFWLTVLLLYPAWDLSTPVVFYVSSGDPMTADAIVYAIGALSLIGAAILVWFARGRLLLLALAPALLCASHYGLSFPPIALVTACLLVLVRFSRLPPRASSV
jgi:hypothetical protein